VYGCFENGVTFQVNRLRAPFPGQSDGRQAKVALPQTPMGRIYAFFASSKASYTALSAFRFPPLFHQKSQNDFTSFVQNMFLWVIQ